MKRLLLRVLRRSIPSGSIAEQSIKSGIWMTGIKVLNRVFQLLMLIVLARLLAPRDFGLMGIALLTLAGIKGFTDIGINAALIHDKRENIDSYLNTVWCLEAGRGLLLFLILFFSAPYIAAFFGEPVATDLIRVIGLTPLVYGLRNPAVVYFRKDLAFHKEFAYQTSGGLVQFLVGVGYALFSPTVWALVFAFLSTEVARTSLSYVMHGYRPWPRFRWDAAAELIDYGKWITASSIVYYLYSKGDDAFVGWYLSATALGFYQYAYQLADAPSSEISETISSVTFPAYSKLQDNPSRLREAFLATTRFTAFLTVPMAFGIALITPSFVPVVLGDEWLPMVLTMQLLALYGLLHALTRNFGSIWKAVGRPDIITKLGLIRVVCIAIFIWPATARWGIEGTAFVVVAVYFFPLLPLDVYFVSKFTHVAVVDVFREFWYPFVAGTTMFGVLWVALLFVDVPAIVELIILIPAGAVVYAGAAFVLDHRFNWGIRGNLESIVKGVMS